MDFHMLTVTVTLSQAFNKSNPMASPEEILGNADVARSLATIH